MLRLPYNFTSILFQYSPGNQSGLSTQMMPNDLYGEDYVVQVVFGIVNIARFSILIVSLVIALRTSHYHVCELSIGDEIILPSFRSACNTLQCQNKKSIHSFVDRRPLLFSIVRNVTCK